MKAKKRMDYNRVQQLLNEYIAQRPKAALTGHIETELRLAFLCGFEGGLNEAKRISDNDRAEEQRDAYQDFAH